MKKPKKTRYAQLLKNARWHQRRDEILNRDNHHCQQCGSEYDLQVHHRYYISQRLPWNYPSWALITLCAKCHSRYHQSRSFEEWEWLMQDLAPHMEQFQDLADLICTTEKEIASAYLKSLMATLKAHRAKAA